MSQPKHWWSEQAGRYAREAARTEPIYAERARGTRRTAYKLNGFSKSIH
jgi:hypothetical protein